MKRSPTLAGSSHLALTLLVFLGTVSGVAIIGIVVGLMLQSMHLPADPQPVWITTATAGMLDVNPEPIERTLFALLAAATPASLVAVFRYIGSARTRVPQAIDWMLPVIVGVLVSFPFAASDFLDVYFFPTEWNRANRWELFLIAAVGSAGVIIHSQISSPTRRHTIAFIASAVCTAFALQIMPWRILTAASVTSEMTWGQSFDAMMYAASQVVAGKTLLADLPSQYGLFPELLAPIFKAIGLSVLTISCLFAALQLLSLCSIAILLRRYVRSLPIAAMTFLAVLVSTSLYLYLLGYNTEVYMQYFPVRLFWPTLTLALFARTVRRPSYSGLIILGIFAGLSLVWNLDSGVPVAISIAATLFAMAIFTKHPTWSAFSKVTGFCITVIATVLIFFVLLRIKADRPLHLGQAFAYQQAFYISGFGMLPLPMPIHPWQSVLSLYVLGTVFALDGLRRRSTDSAHPVALCACLMGTGLFTYYQGRSHIYCLVMVLWPALVVGAILTDRALRAIRSRMFPYSSMALAAPFVMFVSLSSLTLITAAPGLMQRDDLMIANFNRPLDETVAEELAFIRETRKGRSCLILSQRQAIYYAESGSASPLPGPGLIETILQRDLDALSQAARTQPIDCIYLGSGPKSAPFVDIGSAELARRYSPVAQSKHGTMRLLEPR